MKSKLPADIYHFISLIAADKHARDLPAEEHHHDAASLS